ncbi:MAG: NYN domain-containing protein [Candidatus Omnitrophica bacterium]|nr:NYN domain-containing protein [Candidatus Omnitrophota bacterium]
MAVSFIIDGYNVIKRIPELADRTLEDGRSSLIHFLEIHRPQGSLKNDVIVVFDGRSDVWGPQKASFVKVFFTSDETADEKIKRMVDGHPNKKSVVVVTEDREIQYYVRASGAKVLGVYEFLDKAGEKGFPAAGKKGFSQEHKNVSKNVEAKINAEMEKIWLKERS